MVPYLKSRPVTRAVRCVHVKNYMEHVNVLCGGKIQRFYVELNGNYNDI